MTDELNQRAELLKISDWGVVKARVFEDLCLDLRADGIEEEKAQKMCNPFLYMKNAKSVIVCIFSYNTPEKGNISKYAFGKDYHKVVSEKLREFAAPIVEKGYKCSVYSDSWDLNERYLAVAAGLGFVGDNHLFISPKFGSFVFIGVILTDCRIEKSNQCENKCIGCGKCIEACPGGAISKGGAFKEERCISHISQKKGELTEEETQLILDGGLIWGCDICQNVCPYNKNAPYTQIEEFRDDKITELYIDENMSNREFRKKYADRAFSWRGKQPLERNQKILKNNK